MRVSGPVLDAADPVALAEFYARLLGWTVAESEDRWAKILSPTQDLKIEFQWEPAYAPPVWPAAPGEQQMMAHLDVAVENLDAGVAWAVECGATVAAHQPQDDVRVLLDPAGHPFCLFAGRV